MNGVLIIDKPSGLTSHDVVARVRRILKQRAVGHLGTLDPMATGVLPLVIGNMTRLAQFYLSSEKTYEGVIRFGFATNSYDADGEPVGEAKPVLLSLDQVREWATKFLGKLEQMPPPFSAKKVQGVPAYKLARKNKDVALQPVQVEIKQFEIIDVTDDRAQFRASVGSGTYMRSVAHEMGKLAECGAHLASLRRTSVAEFDLEDAHKLEEIAAVAADSGSSEPDAGNLLGMDAGNSPAEPLRTVEDLFVHPRKLLPLLPCVTANDEIAARIRHGRPVNLPELSRARQVKVFQGQRELIAITTRVAGTLFHPKIVFA